MPKVKTKVVKAKRAPKSRPNEVSLKTSIGTTPYDVRIELSENDSGGISWVADGTGTGGQIVVTAFADAPFRHGAGTVVHEILESWMAEKGLRLYKTHSLAGTDPSDCSFYLEHRKFQQMCDECVTAISQGIAAFADLYGRGRAGEQLSSVRSDTHKTKVKKRLKKFTKARLTKT